MMKSLRSYYDDAEFGQIIKEDSHWTLAQCAVLGDRRVRICRKEKQEMLNPSVLEYKLEILFLFLKQN